MVICVDPLAGSRGHEQIREGLIGKARERRAKRLSGSAALRNRPRRAPSAGEHAVRLKIPTDRVLDVAMRSCRAHRRMISGSGSSGCHAVEARDRQHAVRLPSDAKRRQRTAARTYRVKNERQQIQIDTALAQRAAEAFAQVVAPRRWPQHVLHQRRVVLIAQIAVRERLERVRQARRARARESRHRTRRSGAR